MSEPLRIPLSEPYLSGNAREYLEDCLRTNFVSSVGPFVERFEEAFARYVGSRYAVACASGTAALHVAARLLGVSEGDEVLVPTLTFIASANPIRYERGSVVLVDAETETWNLDPSLVAEELDRRARAGLPQPRAVEVVHVLGHPANVEPVVEVCARHGVEVFEDAAEALGARFREGSLAGRHVGTVGRVGCFSFNGNKIITSGGGGMIVTDEAELARRARHLTTQARMPGLEYRHDEIGYNYRLTNIAAALGLAQLEQLPTFLERKRRIAAAYDEALQHAEGLTLPPRAPWAEPSMWLYSIGVEPAKWGRDRSEVLAHLRADGIEARPIWTPLHTMSVYRSARRLGSGVVAERLGRGVLSLPSSVGLTGAEQAKVIAALRSTSRVSVEAG